MKSYKENVEQFESIKKKLESGYYSMAIIELEFLVSQLKRELKETPFYKIAEAVNKSIKVK